MSDCETALSYDYRTACKESSKFTSPGQHSLGIVLEVGFQVFLLFLEKVCLVAFAHADMMHPSCLLMAIVRVENHANHQ